MNAAEIARALGGRKAGAWWSCRCPAHNDHDPSLGVRDGDRSVIVRCFAGCDSRDVIAALRARGLWDGRDRDDYRSRAGPRPRRDPDRTSTTAAARALWRKARPAAETIVAQYLAARGIEAPIPPTLRFLAECWHRETRTIWCAHCGKPLGEPGRDGLPYLTGDGGHTWLHSGYHGDWTAKRRAEVVAALAILSLQPSAETS